MTAESEEEGVGIERWEGERSVEESSRREREDGNGTFNNKVKQGRLRSRKKAMGKAKKIARIGKASDYRWDPGSQHTEE